MAEEKNNAEEVKVSEADTLGIKGSVIKMAGFKGKDDPAKVAKEEKRHEKLIETRIANRIAKAKALAKMTKIQKRKALIVSRFKAIRAKKRTYTYSNKNVAAWTEELEMINNNPKQWIHMTANGTKPFNASNKRKMTAKEKLDGMDLDK